MTTPDSLEGSSSDSGYTVSKRAKFPKACAKCGAKDGLTARRRTFAYVPRAVYVAFLFGCVGMVLGAFLCVAARETTELTVPTCSKCATTWDRASRRPILLFAGSLVATLAASGWVLMLNADRVWLPLALGLLVTSVGPVALHFSGRKDRVWVKNIDETTVTLVGLHPEVGAELQAR